MSNNNFTNFPYREILVRYQDIGSTPFLRRPGAFSVRHFIDDVFHIEESEPITRNNSLPLERQQSITRTNL